MDFDLPTMIIGLAFVAAMASIGAVAYPFLGGDTMSSRLKAVASRRQELSATQRAGLQPKTSRLKPTGRVSLMQEILKKLKLDELLEAKELRKRLLMAGYRTKNAPIKYTFACVATPLFLMGLASLYVTGILAHLATAQKAGIFVGAGAFGYYLPSILLSNTIKKRQLVMQLAFPDSLDLLVICVESGLSIEAAFVRVADEMAETSPIMSEEIGLTAAELAFLSERRQAYENFADRTGLSAVKSLCTTLGQAERYGTSIAVGLRVLSQENRESRLAAAEKKAASLPAKLTVPMIIFFLPVLFVVIAGPAAINISSR
jgi:tight adherence protein C